MNDILNPKGWVLLGFIMDPRTGLGRFSDYEISNYALMETLIEECRTKTIEEILANPHVQQRIKRYNEQNDLFKKMLEEHTETHGNVIVTDLRDVSPIYSGNRFLIYALYPEQNISIWIVDGKNKQNVSIAIGHSILNRTSNTDVGALCLKYNGGGHKQVGTCQVAYEDCDKTVKECINQMNREGWRSI
jgi:nanoRNase/pAp phosphatase (c-di-AMP/oligoRNAs hydrolase)